MEDVDLFVGGLLESAEEVLYSTILETNTTIVKKLARVFLDQLFSAWLVTSSKGLKLVIGLCRFSSSDLINQK